MKRNVKKIKTFLSRKIIRIYFHYLTTTFVLQVNIENIFISGLLKTTRVTYDVIGKVNELIKDICKVERCFYVSNDNITHTNIFKDGLHLLDNSKQILVKNFVFKARRT